MRVTIPNPRRILRHSARSLLREQSIAANRAIWALWTVIALPFSLLSIPCFCCCFAPGVVHAASLPVERRVVSGMVTIARPFAKHMLILQGGPSAVVEWDSFDIGFGSTVQLQQPSPLSVMINRVTGDHASMIGGDLRANGSVVLVNPNGIAFERSANVEVANFVASAVALSDREIDSMFARWRSANMSHQDVGEGQPQMVPSRRTVFPQLMVRKGGSGIASRGTIKTHSGGNIALVGQFIQHDGVIIADAGQVAMLGLGSAAEAKPVAGAGPVVAHTRIGAQAAAPSALSAATSTVAGGVASARSGPTTSSSTTGSVSGSAERSATSATSATSASRVEETVNLSGTIRTGTVMPGLEAVYGGRIAVDGRDGVVNVSGVMMASVGQRNAHGVGGHVDIAGKQIYLRNALVDVRGAVCGGAIALSTSSDHASDQKLHVDGRSALFAQALGTGNGGDIHVSSAGETKFDGAAVASGERALSPHAYPGAGLAVSTLLRRHSSVTTLGEGGNIAVTGQSRLMAAAKIDVSSAQGSTKGQVSFHGPDGSAVTIDPQIRSVVQPMLQRAAPDAGQATAPPEKRRQAWGLSVATERALLAGDAHGPRVVTPVPSDAVVANAISTAAYAATAVLRSPPTITYPSSTRSWEMFRAARMHRDNAEVTVRATPAVPLTPLPNMVFETVSGEI